MQQRVVTATGNSFEQTLRKLLARAKDGAITISRQDGKVLHLTITETHTDLNPDSGEIGVWITEEEFETLLSYIQSVRFGTVIVKIQKGKIVGVEKSEKIKL